MIQNRFTFLNKYQILSQGSYFNFCSNYSLRVDAGFRELTPDSEYKFLLSVETSKFYSIPKLENFLNYKAKITIEVA